MHAARFVRRLAKDHGRAMAAAATAAATATLAASGTATDARAEGRLTSATQFLLHQQQPHATWPAVAAPLAAPLARADELRQRYRVDSVIGRGGFGLVHEGRCKRSDQRVAIKRVAKQTTSRAKFLQEVAILRAVGGRHHVISLCEAFETPDAFVLVTELVDGQELFDHLVTDGAFSAPRAQRLTRDVARALAYLHAQGVVHGDLKPENILLAADDATKLIDFGQAFREHVAGERSRCVGSGVATIAYAAPEVLAAKETGDWAAAGSAIDMWGLGVVLFTALCGFHPFDPENDASDAQLAERIARGAFETDAPEWEALPATARDLISRLLHVDAAQRPTAEQVLAHPWLS